MATSIHRRCTQCQRTNRVPIARLAERGACGACKATLPPLAEPLEVDQATFDAIVATVAVPIVVDFWAPWCGPCRMAAPEVATAAAELAGRALVLKVNTDAEPGLASRYQVRSIPTFGLFRDGRTISLQPGLQRAPQLIAMATRAAVA